MKTKDLADALVFSARVAAIGAVTVTPLMGFVVGDKRPSVIATVLQLMIAVVTYCAALIVMQVDRRRSRITRPTVRTPLDVAVARRQAHAAGLPWTEADGTLSWPKPTPEQVHADLHQRRIIAQVTDADRMVLKMMAGASWGPGASLTLPSGLVLSGDQVIKAIRDADLS